MKNRQRWILHSRPEGFITIDEGAVSALHRHKSLLPKGVLTVRGEFAAGAVVQINEIAKIVSNYSSTELEKLLGQHSSKIDEILGRESPGVIARPEETVFLDE